jgi:hypothetical protein
MKIFRNWDISKIIRRTHMYLALFLMPWMFMYSLSTIMMNHRDLVVSFYQKEQPDTVRDREVSVSGLAVDMNQPDQAAERILSTLGLDGAHNVRGGMENKPLVITRHNPFGQQIITYDPQDQSAVIEQQEFRTFTMLERLHRRRGYQHEYLLEDTWALSVDTAIIAMLFWALSGIWMWWELKTTRKWGAIAAVSGMGLFVLFLILI